MQTFTSLVSEDAIFNFTRMKKGYACLPLYKGPKSCNS